jgi:hypothetical protein
VLSLPMHPYLDEPQISQVCEAVAEAVEAASSADALSR